MYNVRDWCSRGARNGDGKGGCEGGRVMLLEGGVGSTSNCERPQPTVSIRMQSLELYDVTRLAVAHAHKHVHCLPGSATGNKMQSEIGKWGGATSPPIPPPPNAFVHGEFVED